MDGRKVRDIVITVVLIAAVAVTGVMSLYIRYIDGKSQMEYDLLRPTPVVGKVSLSIKWGEGEQEKHYPEFYIDYKLLKQKNPEFRGWFYFPALDISYPIVQGKDNDYYLRHSFEKEDNRAGCIFMDSEASPDWSDCNTFVFGHNMRDESMFGKFKNLMAEPSLCADDPYFYIYTEDGVYIYEIFAFYETMSTSDRYMTFKLDKSYDEYVKWALDNSLYTFDRDMSDRGNIVSLSTCYGPAGTKKRALIHGALNAVEN